MAKQTICDFCGKSAGTERPVFEASIFSNHKDDTVFEADLCRSCAKALQSYLRALCVPGSGIVLASLRKAPQQARISGNRASKGKSARS